MNSEKELEEAYRLFEAEKYDKAFPLYKKLAENGNAEAQYVLALCYEYGYGVADDLEKALYWYTQSDNGGYFMAKDAIDRVKEEL